MALVDNIYPTFSGLIQTDPRVTTSGIFVAPSISSWADISDVSYNVQTQTYSFTYTPSKPINFINLDINLESNTPEKRECSRLIGILLDEIGE